MIFVNTTAAQDRTIGKLEDVAGLWSDAVGIIEDLDSRLSSALTDVSNLREQIEDLKTELYEAKNGGES